jgi:hypothetical protein
MALAMALFLKHFVVEAYKIPSGSMQPTLIGDAEAGIEDRILVDKLSYRLRAPRRWEVAVFRFPPDRSKSFVKRIAGVGPEELRILHGDLWRRAEGEDWGVLRRPPAVQAQAWRPLDLDAPEASRWIPEELPAQSRWEPHGRALAARGSGTAAFRGGRESIVDAYLDGYPEALCAWMSPHARSSGENPVGDLRVAGEIRALPGLELFCVVLAEGERRYRFELPGPDAAPGASARIEAGAWARSDPSARARAYRLPPGERVRFAAQNLDDRLALELDGEELLALEVLPAEDQSSSARLELAGEGADLEALMVYRDVYYTGSGEAVAIPAGHYYMLGDNTQDSSDSREWSFALLETAGPGPARRLRGYAREGENPLVAGYGEEGGPFTRLVDEWGEPHWFERGAVRRTGAEPAPFVPRDMVQGKALAVFWPLDPRRGIWRLRWVN